MRSAPPRQEWVLKAAGIEPAAGSFRRELSRAFEGGSRRTYEAVRDNLATLLAEASEVGRGLPRYVERDFARYL